MLELITTQRLKTEEPIPEEVLLVLDSICLSSKNIYNASLFIAKNVLSNYIYNKDSKTYKLKDKRHQNEIDMLVLANKAIELINEKKSKKEKDNSDSKLAVENDLEILNGSNEIKDSNDSNKNRKLTQYNEEISPKTYWQIINKTLLETSLKLKEQLNPKFLDYCQLHSHIAQPSLQSVCNDFSNYKKSIVAYYKNKSLFLGLPKFPSYKGKSDRKTFSVSLDRFLNNNTGNHRDTFIPVLKSNKLFLDSQKKKSLSKKAIKIYNEYPLVKYCLEFVKKYHSHAKLVEIKIVPGKHDKLPRIDCVIKEEVEAKNYLVEIEKRASGYLNKQGLPKTYNELTSKEKEAIINGFVKELGSKKVMPDFVSIDCGLVNFLTLAYNSNKRFKAKVISGYKFKNDILNIDKQIDGYKSKQYTNELKAIQAKIDSNRKNKNNKDYIPLIITKKEYDFYKKSLKAIYSNIDYRKLVIRKNNIVNDFIHKVSRVIINDCKSKNINLIILGHNDLWKNESNMGRKNNRLNYNFPHSRLIELLKYKSVKEGILFVETEESYTSKTSFIDNEKLDTYQKNEEKIESSNLSDNEEVSQGNQSQRLGKRINRKFITKDKITIHADVNGAFNIARKVLKGFKYDRKSNNTKFDLVIVSKWGHKKFSKTIASSVARRS